MTVTTMQSVDTSETLLDTPIKDKKSEISLVLRETDYESILMLAKAMAISMAEFVNRAITCYEYLLDTEREGRIVFVQRAPKPLELDIKDLRRAFPTQEVRPEDLAPQGNGKILTTLVLQMHNIEKIARKAERHGVTTKKFLAEAIRLYYFLRNNLPKEENGELSLYIGETPGNAYRYIVP